jgi:2,4-dienoyl-CoA reductase-like NADH-dependent reductase (Old Yellow Enzyme family)/thioredoxin reductase
MIAGLSKLAEEIKANGATAILQLGHGGRQANPEAHQGYLQSGVPYNVAPSAIPSSANNITPKELTIEEIEEVQNAWAQAARRAQWAGFNGVEIHGAHGYLIGEFMSPKTNIRTDKYGGLLANRARFFLETIGKVRAMVGPKFIVGFRISGDEYVPGGLTIEESAPYAKMIANTGKIDYIHVSAGTYESFPHVFPVMYYERAHLLHLAEAVKEMVKNVPIITVGSHNWETGEKTLRDGKADLIAIGRGLIAEPNLPNMLAAGRIEDARPCILCNEGCISHLFFGRPARCAINPAVGRETSWNLKPAHHKKRVMVIGGGIAGMEAARISAIKGHEVTLVEKTDKLGGHLIEASAPSFKNTVKDLLTWTERQTKNLPIRLKMNVEANFHMIQQEKPDVLIIAVGSDYCMPDAEGVAACITGKDVLLGKASLGNNVVVIGGGIVGCETALHIAETAKKNIAVVEMLDDILVDQELTHQMVLKERLQAAGVKIHTGLRLKQVVDTGIVCDDKEGVAHDIPADSVVSCSGLKGRIDLAESLKSLVAETYVIGDCAGGVKIYDAFEHAWRAVLICSG